MITKSCLKIQHEQQKKTKQNPMLYMAFLKTVMYLKHWKGNRKVVNSNNER